MNEAISSIFEEVLRIEQSKISRELTAKDVNGWDSLAHVILISRLEQEFAISFSLAEIADLDMLGDLVDLVNSKVGSQ
jgi:acyl carrier protein